MHGLATLAATYRGRIWYDIPAEACIAPPSREASTHQPRRPRPRASFMSWNCVALNSHDYLELMQWLALQQLDIVMLQSTHWTISEPSQKFGYTAFPSTEHNSHGGGLIVFIRCGADTVSVRHPWPASAPALLHISGQCSCAECLPISQWGHEEACGNSWTEPQSPFPIRTCFLLEET